MGKSNIPKQIKRSMLQTVGYLCTNSHSPICAHFMPFRRSITQTRHWCEAFYYSIGRGRSVKYFRRVRAQQNPHCRCWPIYIFCHKISAYQVRMSHYKNVVDINFLNKCHYKVRIFLKLSVRTIGIFIKLFFYFLFHI